MSSKNEYEKHHDHKKTYTLVWIALLFLTAVTVYVSYFDFGHLNIAVAMLVATIKASLVCLYFMHLKYDNRLNQVVFISSFVFFAIYVALTLSDIETRHPPKAFARVTPINGPAGAEMKEMGRFYKSSSESISKGKQLFQAQCVACHGAEGHGDGPAAGSLNPKPRSFIVSEGWKNGRAPSQIFMTLKNGIPGSGMASFATLPLEDRWSLAHYVHSLNSTNPPDTEETLKLVGLKSDGSPLQASASSEATAELPISFAIDRLVEEAKKEK